jgi:PERQ amino acid-rich with GYF domain-containing protein
MATNASHQRETSQPANPAATSAVYVPPHLNSNYQPSFTRNTSTVDSRYSKEQLLDLFRAQGDLGNMHKNVAEHLIEGWNPGPTSSAANGMWTRREDHKDSSNAPEICWDSEGSVQPLGLIDFSEEEKEVLHQFL